MKKDAFIQAVVVEMGDNPQKVLVERVLQAAGKVGLAILNGGDLKVPMLGLGKLSVEKRAARKGRNPQTGAALDIPEGLRIKYSPSKAAKDALK